MVGKFDPMATRDELLDQAVAVLRRGDVLTLDALAREAGLTKPGVVHHFSTKQGLMLAVVDHIVDQWETDLLKLAGPDADGATRLRAYVEHAFTGTFDASDLAVLADPHLRERMRQQWITRLTPWLGTPAEAGPRPAGELAARLLADGAWFNQALGVPVVDDAERLAVRQLALELLDAPGDPASSSPAAGAPAALTSASRLSAESEGGK